MLPGDERVTTGRPAGTGRPHRLLQSADRPGVTVQLLPFHAGSHAATGGPVTILRFAGSDLTDIVYLEQLNSAIYLDRRSDVEDYSSVWERVVVQALTPDDTRATLREMLADTVP